MKVLLTGRTGQVGWELEQQLTGLGELHAFGRTALDLVQPDRVIATVRELKPDIIINAAAYTAVDRAESEREAAFAINAHGPGILAEEARRLDALLVHYSTDYVFDGTKPEPYSEDDPPSPANVYGASKLAGEKAIAEAGARHWIFRTSWVYAPRGKNFLLTILRLAREGKPLRVVADQFGAPTSAAMIARATVQAMSVAGRADIASGIYNMSASGRTSWHGFACAILATFGLSGQVQPIPSSQYVLPAKRPANSVFAHDRLAKTFGVRLPNWEEGLQEAATKLARQGDAQV